MDARKTRVLFVDDDVELGRAMKMTLEQTGGYHVLNEARPARSLLAARMFRPDVILLDVHMPVIDGGELAARFRSDTGFKHTPIVFYTALVAPEEDHRLADERFVSKTAGFPQLVRSLEEAVAS